MISVFTTRHHPHTGQGKDTLQRTLSKPKERRGFMGFGTHGDRAARAGPSSNPVATVRVAQVVAQNADDLERKASV